MKPTPIILSAVLGIGLGIAIAYLVNNNPGPTTTNGAVNTNAVTNNRSVTNTNSSGVTITGPYPLDGEGCAVINLRDASPTIHDAEGRTYVWRVEHPADADCIRQTNPSISQPVLESTNEKIIGTNTWQLMFRY